LPSGPTTTIEALEFVANLMWMRKWTHPCYWVPPNSRRLRRRRINLKVAQGSIEFELLHTRMGTLRSIQLLTFRSRCGPTTTKEAPNLGAKLKHTKTIMVIFLLSSVIGAYSQFRRSTGAIFSTICVRGWGGHSCTRGWEPPWKIYRVHEWAGGRNKFIFHSYDKQK
jgi:hypothetical protein